MKWRGARLRVLPTGSPNAANPGRSAGFAARLATCPCEREPAVLDHGYSVDRREAKAFVIASAVGSRTRAAGSRSATQATKSSRAHGTSRGRGRAPLPQPAWRALAWLTL